MPSAASFVIQAREVGAFVEFRLAPPPGQAGPVAVLASVSAVTLRADPMRADSGRSQLFDDLVEAFKLYFERILAEEGIKPDGWTIAPAVDGQQPA